MYQQPNMQPTLTNPTLNTSSMIVGIIGLLLCMLPFFGMIAPAVAILLAVLGRGNQMHITERGLAGFIMGILGLIGNVVFLIFYLAAIYLVTL